MALTSSPVLSLVLMTRESRELVYVRNPSRDLRWVRAQLNNRPQSIEDSQIRFQARIAQDEAVGYGKWSQSWYLA